MLAEISGVPADAPKAGYAIFAQTIERFLKEHLFADLHALREMEGLFVEPSACAGFAGAVELSKMTDYLESSGLGAHWENAAHIVWATGGALVPEGEREKYLAN